MLSKSDKKLALIGILVPAIVALTIGFFQFVLPKIADSQLAPPPTRAFVGKVTDEATGKPIKDAKISLQAKSIAPVIYTDSEGSFSFPIASDVREIKIRVEAKEYNSFERRIDLSAKMEAEDIRLAQVSAVPTPTPSPAPPRGSKSPIRKSAGLSLEERKKRASDILKSNSP